MPSWIIFYITLLNWEFLLKCCNFFWNFYWIRDFLLCTTISIDFNSEVLFPLCQGVGIRKFWKGRSRKFWKLGVGNFRKSEWEILPTTPQPWFLQFSNARSIWQKWTTCPNSMARGPHSRGTQCSCIGLRPALKTGVGLIWHSQKFCICVAEKNKEIFFFRGNFFSVKNQKKQNNF